MTRYFLPFLIAFIVTSIAKSQDGTANSTVAKEMELLQKENELLKKEIQQLKGEIEELKKGVRKKSKSANDSEEALDDRFAVGTIWTGTRFYNNAGAAPEGRQDWKLEITNRKGTRFEGNISFIAIDEKQVSFKVKGKSPNKGPGDVSFESEKKGLFKQYFEGKLDKAGEISMTFRGTNVPGAYVEGKAILRRE